MIWSLLLLFQWPLEHRLLEVEDARRDPAPLLSALNSPALARQAVRGLGRFERSELAKSVFPFLSSSDADLRIEAANALAQMKTTEPLAPFLETERDPRVRYWLYEAIGRLPQAKEALLLPGLEEEETARLGAVKALESFYRVSDSKPSEKAIAALRTTVQESRAPAIRELGLLALNRAKDAHRATLESAWLDPEPQVRRLAISALREWRDDPSPIVRYDALKASPSCSRAEASLSDPSEHVVLLAIDLLAQGCPPGPLETALRQTGWRRSAHALVSLAQTAPDRAKEALPGFVGHPVWQARVYAARAAKILGDQESLAKLRSDSHPNVVAEALVSPEDALRALPSHDYGLLVAALEKMKGWEEGASAVPALLGTLSRVSDEKKHTSRDPRTLLLERLREFADRSLGEKLDYLLSDFDPEVASLAAQVIAAKTERDVRPKTLHFAPDPLPSDSFLLGLAGAKAKIRMKEAGGFTVELLPEVAPLTVSRFAQLAESGFYNGLTFHRIVPNFVIQGGSPGANEYVGTPGYIRDEVSLLSHERGTLGISTRGRDTGDSQIFVNLVDNFRLDHNYTVFARVTEGMDLVDSIQEGDVLSSISIERAVTR